MFAFGGDDIESGGLGCWTVGRKGRMGGRGR